MRKGEISKVKDIKVVIGAGYGDEGKGLMTDYFTKEGLSCLVVCSNGGAQRGHTVTGNGIRHVFHHFGSGSLSGADTWLSRYFILNPILFAEEYERLENYHMRPVVYRSPECIWTTPFDMMINQIVEESRGDGRHGSCGVGIWETVVRSGKIHRPLDTFARADAETSLKDYLLEIRDSYLPRRLTELGIETVPEEWKAVIRDDRLMEHFIEDVLFLISHTIPGEKDILYHYDRIIFENGQGILLDQNQPFKEHTTPSNTGLQNPARIIEEAGLGNLPVEVCYVTRTYLTRHGAGPFPGECEKDRINPDMSDETNMPNAFQGSLRYGIINPDKMWLGAQSDFDKYAGSDSWQISLAITHLNETGGKWNNAVRIVPEDFRRAGKIYRSDGRTKESVNDGKRSEFREGISGIVRSFELQEDVGGSGPADHDDRG